MHNSGKCQKAEVIILILPLDIFSDEIKTLRHQYIVLLKHMPGIFRTLPITIHLVQTATLM